MRWLLRLLYLPFVALANWDARRWERENTERGEHDEAGAHDDD